MKEVLKMKDFWRRREGGPWIAGAAAVLLAAVIACCGIWHYQQPKFRDLTIELGTDTVSISDFMTGYARAEKAFFVSDPAAVDLNRVGRTELVLRHGSKEETVTLTIQDTTAPAADIAGEYKTMIDDLPEAKELVSNVQDMSKTEIYFLHELVVPADYRDVTVTIVVEDACGNAIRQDCVVSFVWMQEHAALELGEELTKEMLLLNPERDAVLLDQAALDQINASGIGEYAVTSVSGTNELTCTVTVQDTKGPELELNAVQRAPGNPVSLEDFVRSVSDISGVAEVRLKTGLDVNTLGTYTVVIEAEDIYGNITTGETTLWVTTDTNPPVIQGYQNTLTVEKHSTPDFLAGISAYDAISGACEVTCDTSKLDLDSAGTYYITYNATDASGNVAAVKRKVVVNHDEEDTMAMVREIAAKLSDDPEKIRDYVRSSIYYNHDWGGDDPVWYGFTNRTGNCYVHAMCLKAIFDLKGIENQVIWVTNQTHYWLLVKIGDGWKHIDPTPSRIHGRYSLMNDRQRLETLSGRVWDTTQWPACE